MRLLFAGTPAFAAHHLQVLLDDGRHSVVGVYTQPDRPAGRGKQPRPSAVKAVALSHGLAVVQPESLKEVDAQQQLAAFNADLMVVVAYGLLLPQAVLDIPPLGCINVHGSLLPKWRGAAPIQRAVEAGDATTGITIMQMEAGLDTGPALLRRETPIGPADTAGSLFSRLQTLGGEALLSALELLEEGSATAEPQDEQAASYARKISKAEAELDWRAPAATLVRKIHALNPSPGAYTLINGERIKIWAAAEVAGDSQQPPGTLLQAPAGELWVACGDRPLAIVEAQLAGKKPQPAAELLRGHAALLRPGAMLGAAE